MSRLVEPFKSEEERQEKAVLVPEVAQKLTRAEVLGDAEASELRRMLEVFSPENRDTRERLMKALSRLLGCAAFRWLSMASAQAAGPEEMRELFQVRRW